MSDLITITTFNNLFEANLAASHLEHKGIETFINDENISNIYPNVGGPINLVVGSPFGAYGGVKLKVREEEVPRAIEVLKGNEYFNEEKEEPSEFDESVEKLTNDIPFLDKLPLQAKLVAIVLFILAVVLIISVLIIK
jgi:hypothetical protein